MDGLRRAMDVERKRIFRLLALLFPDRDLHSAHDGLRSDDPAVWRGQVSRFTLS